MAMKCFVIMPFGEPFDPIYRVVKDVAHRAVQDQDFVCYWLKDVHAAGRITDDILQGLKEATFCIADVTGHNPNVMWETGFAMALGKPTILMGQQLQSLPFDLHSHRVIGYSADDLPECEPRLLKAIQETLSRYELKGSKVAAPPAGSQVKHRTIAVTGTMNANEAVVCQRIPQVLTPYLSPNTNWLVGSVGGVDVAVIQFLLEHKQTVTAVGYNRFDYAMEKLRPPIEDGRLAFLDGSIQPVPKKMTGPSRREILFCIKSDLVILFWDGLSPGTQEMIQYYREQATNHLLVFI
jgi:hypothetical protein